MVTKGGLRFFLLLSFMNGMDMSFVEFIAILRGVEWFTCETLVLIFKFNDWCFDHLCKFLEYFVLIVKFIVRQHIIPCKKYMYFATLIQYMIDIFWES